MSRKIPQEILDEIIDEVALSTCHVSLPAPLPQSLRNCALVAKAWTRRSQKHLFTSISIKPDNLDSWRTINDRNHGSLNSHVRFLVVEQDDLPDRIKLDPDTMEAPRPYLNFPNLQVLTLSQWDNFAAFSLPRTFGHYSTPSLRSLKIINSISDGDAILELVALFPDVEELVIDSAYVINNQITKSFFFPNLIRWRTLRIVAADSNMVGVLDVISRLPLQCQLLDISYELLEDPRPVLHLISTCSATLKYMRLEQTHREEPCPGIAPGLLPELEELALCSDELSEDLIQPDTLKLDVLGSIICPKLREIVINHTDSDIFEEHGYTFDTGDWARIDGFLVKLAERTESRLRVVLHLMNSSHQYNGPVMDTFLPAFRKVGDFVVVIFHEVE